MKIFVSVFLLSVTACLAAAQTRSPDPAPASPIGTSITDKDAFSKLPRATTPQTLVVSRDNKGQAASDTLITQKQIEDFPATQPKQQSTYTRPSADTRFKKYINGVIGPFALARNAASAGFSTWRNSPEEWKPTWEGFGRRFASGLGINAIRGTTIYVLDESLKLDSSYYRSAKKSLKGRLGDALLSTFIARKPDGKKVFGLPRVAGTYAGSVIAAEAWFPKGFDYKDGLTSGTVSLGLGAAFNVFREFFLKK